MFCHKCGTKSVEGAEFCIKCGTALIIDDEEPQLPEKPAKTAASPSLSQRQLEALERLQSRGSATEAYSGSDAGSLHTQIVRNRRKKGLVFALIAIAVIAVTISLIITIPKKQTEKKHITSLKSFVFEDYGQVTVEEVYGLLFKDVEYKYGSDKLFINVTVHFEINGMPIAIEYRKYQISDTLKTNPYYDDQMGNMYATSREWVAISLIFSNFDDARSFEDTWGAGVTAEVFESSVLRAFAEGYTSFPAFLKYTSTNPFLIGAPKDGRVEGSANPNANSTGSSSSQLTADEALSLAAAWLADHPIDPPERLSSEHKDKTINGKEYYRFFLADSWMYYFSILVNKETGEMLHCLQSDGEEPYEEVEPLDDWYNRYYADSNAGASGYSQEVCFLGAPVWRFLGLTLDDVVEVLGSPSYGASSGDNESFSLFYNDDIVFNSDWLTIYSVEVISSWATVGGVALNLTRSELVRILGEPGYEGTWHDGNYLMEYTVWSDVPHIVSIFSSGQNSKAHKVTISLYTA